MKNLLSHPRARKTLISFATFLVIFSIVGFFILPPIARNALITRLSEELGRNVSIQALRINPYTLGVTVEGLTVFEPEGNTSFIRADEVYLNLEIASLFKGGAVINELVLKKPYLNIVRNADASYNFSDLLEADDGSPAARFSVNNIQITGGSIDFDDRPAATRHTLREIALTVPFISNLPHDARVYVEPSFTALLNGRRLSFSGKTKPFEDSLETLVNLDVKDLDISHYLSYLPEKTGFSVASGRLTAGISVSYRQSATRLPSLEIQGAVTIDDLRVNDRKRAPLVSLHRASAEIGPSDIFAGRWVLKRIALDRPESWISLSEEGVFNLERAFTPGAKAKKGKETPLSVEIREAVADKGSLHFSDSSRGRNLITDIDGIALTVKDFTTAPGGNAEFLLQARSELDEQVRVSGTFSLNPLSATGVLDVKNLSARKYAPYYRDFVQFDVGQGSLDLSSPFEYRESDGGISLILSDLAAAASGLRARMRDGDVDFADIPALKMEKGRIDLASRSVSLGTITGAKGAIRPVRLNDGTLNLQRLLAPEPEGGASAPSAEAAAKRPWTVRLESADLSGFTVALRDLLIDPPLDLTFKNIAFKAKNLSTEANTKGRMRADISLGKGTLSLRGRLGINPPVADLKVALRSVDIPTLFPYFADRVSLTVTDGLLTTDGQLAFAVLPGKPLQLTYKGGLSIVGFDSVDTDFENDLLSWENLTISGLSIVYNPFLVKMASISVSDFYAMLVINPDGSFNLLNILNKPVVADPENVRARLIDKVYDDIKEKPAKDLIIEQVTLQGGIIDFSDTFIEPTFETTMYEVGGKIDGLSSEATAIADVDLAGKLENHAPLTIRGKINPLRDDFFVDVHSEFRNMDLSPLSPYSGKYAGYTIHKGKLSHRVEYKINKRELDASHTIFLDQLTLGEKVESPDATSLPVKLAIALLKDREGKIELDLPVSGSIDDPDFSVGRLVLKMIVNLLVKAATAPFALIGSLFGGGGEEMSYIEFPYGQSKINEEGMKKIESLAAMLQEKDSIDLEIEGIADREKDSEGIKDLAVERKVKAQKLKDLVKSGQEGKKIDDVVIGKEEYEKYLKAAYKEEKFPKPKNILGLTKDLPVPEMEKLMRANIKATDAALKDLARRRGQAVKEALMKTGKVGEERLFIVEETIAEPGDEGQKDGNRVDFRLQ